MTPISRRKRFLIVSGILVVLVGALVVTGIFFKRSRAADGSETRAKDSASGQSASQGQGSGGVAHASTKTKEDDKEKAPIPVSVAPIATGAVSSYISSTANLVPENEVKVLAEADGRVAQLLVEEGNRVAKGQVLAQLVKDDAEISLKKAQVRLENARINFERAQQELASNLISREQYDKDSLDNQIAQQELAEAKWRLEKTTIRSPFGGRVTERFVKLGQHLHPGEQLFTVSDFDPLVARIFLPEKDVFGLKEGRDVRITLKANDTTRFHGRIRQISPVVDTGTGTVKLTIEATAPPDEVRPGAFVTIDIVRETRPQAILVPREAVVRELQDAYVFVVNGGVAEKRTISLGLEEGGRVEALSGVKAGEQVIVAGQGGLKQGSAIKVIPAPEASDLGTLDDRPVRG
ncbi:MAG TPA: efflux RND transporter periplasmic adaptor subunit [Candidatus Polarisedimenticolia bacterium]|jgi:membrane fusion protein (multidrug efflux system)|nr:efflux RND transporter periplasmic adaptor subunit [Candidatus Polarisedimenticolia bacterium]